MGTGNPMNPHTQNEEEIEAIVEPPVAKAEVVQAARHDDKVKGFHSVRVRVYGETSTFLAPILTMMQGDAHVPPVGSDVAVMYGPNEKPWVVGYWYATDGDAEPPDYMPGERIIGSPLSESFIKIAADGHIEIKTEGLKRVDIDHQTSSVYLTGANQSIPAGNTDKILFDTVEEDLEDLWDEANNQMVARADGLHRINATVALPTPGQNNSYSIYIYVNGSPVKRVTRQSAVNEELSLTVVTMELLDEGDVVDIRVENGSGSPKDVLGSEQTTEFDMRRSGI